MFYGQAAAGSAMRRYAAVHAGSRIEGASPHALVKILFDELLLAMDAAALAERQMDPRKATDRLTRAMAILHALETSLDFDKGGDVAVGLAQIYRESRRLLVAAAADHDPAKVDKARAMIGEIAEAWAMIG